MWLLIIGIIILILAIVTLVFLKIDKNKKIIIGVLLGISNLLAIAFGLGSNIFSKEMNYEINDMNQTFYNKNMKVFLDNEYFELTFYACNEGRTYEVIYKKQNDNVISEYNFLNLSADKDFYTIEHNNLFNVIKNNEESINQRIENILNENNNREEFFSGWIYSVI